jgi:hypothetical protein
MSKIQKFKTFLEASAADLTPVKKDDDERKKAKYRSKGEQDFADAHTTETEPHPTADPSVHNGSTQPTSPKGSDAGEKQVVAAGTSVKEPAGGGDSKRSADKKQGDMTPVNPIKEAKQTKEEEEPEDEDEDDEDEEDEDEDDEEELEEGVMDTLRKIVKDKQMQKVKFANGKTMRIDMATAAAMVNAYDKRIKNDATKKKFADAVEKDPNSFMKMMDVAMGGK